MFVYYIQGSFSRTICTEVLSMSQDPWLTGPLVRQALGGESVSPPVNFSGLFPCYYGMRFVGFHGFAVVFAGRFPLLFGWLSSCIPKQDAQPAARPAA